MIYTPMKMQPCYKEYLWGGARLKSGFGKADAPEVTAESWELASHPDGESRIQSGAYAGKTIRELGRLDHDGFWGCDCRTDSFTPAWGFWLISRIIWAREFLSTDIPSSIIVCTILTVAGVCGSPAICSALEMLGSFAVLANRGLSRTLEPFAFFKMANVISCPVSMGRFPSSLARRS